MVGTSNEGMPVTCAEDVPQLSAGSNEVAEIVEDLVATEGTEGGMEDGEGGSDSDAETKRAACGKYQEFQKSCGELLDPSE